MTMFTLLACNNGGGGGGAPPPQAINCNLPQFRGYPQCTGQGINSPFGVNNGWINGGPANGTFELSLPRRGNVLLNITNAIQFGALLGATGYVGQPQGIYMNFRLGQSRQGGNCADRSGEWWLNNGQHFCGNAERINNGFRIISVGGQEQVVIVGQLNGNTLNMQVFYNGAQIATGSAIGQSNVIAYGP